MPTSRPLRLLTLCTGNAARSVIAGAILSQALPEAEVRTAGTLVVEDQPMSIRTRRAIEHLGLVVPPHRSHQLTADDCLWADVVVAMAAEHVGFVRVRHPLAASQTATVWWLARNLPDRSDPLEDRLRVMDLAAVDPARQQDVDDPAGGTDQQYLHCADQLVEAVGMLIGRMHCGAGLHAGAGPEHGA